MIVSMSTILEVVMSSEYSPVQKLSVGSNISARIWNVLSNKINCDVSMSILKCNLKLFLLNNELVLNYLNSKSSYGLNFLVRYMYIIIIVSHYNPRCIFFSVCIVCVFTLIPLRT